MTDSSNVQATIAMRVKQYVDVRDKLKQMDEAHDKARADIVAVKDLLEGWIQQFMDTAGVTSVKTDHGTTFTTTRYSASLADPAAFMDFVVKTNQLELLDRKANVTAVRDYVETHKQLPPGVNLSARTTVNVRRAADK